MLAQKLLSVITYSREELLDIRETSTYQHHDQEYDFPEADPLFEPPKGFELIPEADLKRPSGQTSEGRTPPTAPEFITR